MRPPERIPRLLELLGKYWREYPDLRLGQLVVVLSRRREKGPLTDVAHLFNMEDDQFLAVLEELLEEIT